jgi:hypothetical protein
MRRSAAICVPSSTSRPRKGRRGSSTACDAHATRTATRRSRWGPRRPRRPSRSPGRCSTPPSPEGSRRDRQSAYGPREVHSRPMVADGVQQSRERVSPGQSVASPWSPATTSDDHQQPEPSLIASASTCELALFARQMGCRALIEAGRPSRTYDAVPSGRGWPSRIVVVTTLPLSSGPATTYISWPGTRRSTTRRRRRWQPTTAPHTTSQS